ncbi:MAG: hypothetical protein AAGC46_11690, partial [Solirubrobacteraceae bacterium]|nr:hypothetical protein [Patulibacter sp.]
SALPALAGRAGRALLRGPKASGVFVRSTGGDGLVSLDGDGRTAGRLGPGTGVVAATRLAPSAPVWFVTGVDRRGIRRAAEALTAPALAHKSAAVVGAGGVQALPGGGR